MREIGYTKSDKLYDYPDLLPCPFCGKRPEMVVNPHRKQETFFVKCMNKKCDIQPLTDEYKDIIKAAKKWNIRSESDVRLPAADVVEVVRCKECKHYQNHPNGLCYLHTEPYGDGYKGDAVCVEPNGFCSYGERKENENE